MQNAGGTASTSRVQYGSKYNKEKSEKSSQNSTTTKRDNKARASARKKLQADRGSTKAGRSTDSSRNTGGRGSKAEPGHRRQNTNGSKAQTTTAEQATAAHRKHEPTKLAPPAAAHTGVR